MPLRLGVEAGAQGSDERVKAPLRGHPAFDAQTGIEQTGVRKSPVTEHCHLFLGERIVSLLPMA